jgi:hypothetical protein
MLCKTPAQHHMYYTVTVRILDSNNKTVCQKSQTLYAIIDTWIAIFNFDNCEFIACVGRCESWTENKFQGAYATFWLSIFNCSNNISFLTALISHKIPTHSPLQVTHLLYHTTSFFFLLTEVRLLRCKPSFHKSSYTAIVFEFVVTMTLRQR